MPAFSVPLSKVAEQLNLETVYAPKELNEIPIYTADVNRPGIVLAGYYQYFDANRIQIFGMVEMSYLQELPAATRRAHLERLFELTPPAVLISRSLEPLPEMIDFARMYSVPVLSSAESTSTLMSALISLLNVELAPRVTRHGVFIEVYGEGILILGDSGVGKSETAVELVKRGHRLIADDAVELRRTSSRTIVGTAPENIRHFIELRGIGIVNVARIFGIGSVNFWLALVWTKTLASDAEREHILCIKSQRICIRIRWYPTMRSIPSRKWLPRRQPLDIRPSRSPITAVRCRTRLISGISAILSACRMCWRASLC